VPALHTNTTLDVEKKMHDFVAELEHEALDEDMVGAACQKACEILNSRADVSRELLRQVATDRVMDNRRERLKAGIKGVKPVLPGGSIVQPVVTGRAH